MYNHPIDYVEFYVEQCLKIFYCLLPPTRWIGERSAVSSLNNNENIQKVFKSLMLNVHLWEAPGQDYCILEEQHLDNEKRQVLVEELAR